MGKITFQHKYEYLEEVYHTTDLEGNPLVIMDVQFRAKSQTVWYLVSKGLADDVWAREEELSKTKRLV